MFGCNYCSMEYSKKLFDMGIVYDTEFVWHKPCAEMKWRRIPKILCGEPLTINASTLPCYTFMDIYRKLPMIIDIPKDTKAHLTIDMINEYMHRVSYNYYDDMSVLMGYESYINENLIHAAIDMYVYLMSKIKP